MTDIDELAQVTADYDRLRRRYDRTVHDLRETAGQLTEIQALVETYCANADVDHSDVGNMVRRALLESRSEGYGAGKHAHLGLCASAREATA